MGQKIIIPLGNIIVWKIVQFLKKTNQLKSFSPPGCLAKVRPIPFRQRHCHLLQPENCILNQTVLSREE